MIESEMSVPAFPNCVCGASALGAIANAEYELVKSLWETRKLTDTEAVRLILQIADKLAVALKRWLLSRFRVWISAPSPGIVRTFHRVPQWCKPHLGVSIVWRSSQLLCAC